MRGQLWLQNKDTNGQQEVSDGAKDGDTGLCCLAGSLDQSGCGGRETLPEAK